MNLNEFYFVKKSIDSLLRDFFRVINRPKNEFILIKNSLRKSYFLYDCDQILFNYFKTKINSILHEKNKIVYTLQ